MAPEGLPSGTVTFLFTDIEGSTALWERDPAAMREALAAHDELIRSTIARSGGTVFKSIGDAFCSVFRDPEDALSAAITAQRDLGKRSWPVQLGPIAVRMGIHTAVCAEVDGDYYGPPVNRVARLMSTAYGGQILVSEAAAGLLRDALPAAVTLRNIGLIRLKGLNRPEPAFQAVGRGIRKNFPAPRSLNSRPSNLPTQISTFVGRTAELQKLDELLARGRLLTIVGPGGIGKTRLTLQLGASVAERFVDGCWLIDLAPVRRADFIAQAAADALGLHERAAANVESTLLEHLADRTLLLILDNVEHLIGGVARLVKAILSHCPTITILATSREPMHVLGEQIFRLGALSEGKALFLERARQVAPTATFDEAADATLATLCARLENIPLAIELACARLSTMTLKGLERRLKSALSLSSKDSTESSRHRTLRDTIAWSYELLSPDERAVLRALSVFNGGCTATAIAAVTPQVDDAGEIADSLVDKSLLLAEEREGDAYYRPLEIVSEYARNELRNAREETKAEAAHAGFYASIILQLPEAKPTRPKTVLLDDEIPNVRLMLEWEFEHDRSTASRLVQALAATWRTRGTISEARSWIGRALDFPEEGLSERPRLLCLAASFATLQDDLSESLRLSEKALEIYRTCDDGEGTAQALFRIAEVRHRQGHLDAAEALYRESLPRFVSFGDSRAEMLCLSNLGMLARQRGDLRQALELLEDAMERAQRLRETRIAGDIAMAIAWVNVGLGDLDSSRELFAHTLAECRDEGELYGACSAAHGLATVDLQQGRIGDAREGFVSTFREARDLRAKDYLARALHGIAAVEAIEGRSDVALRLLGLADRLFRESGRQLHDSIAYEIATAKLDSKIPETLRTKLRQEGEGIDVRDALDALSAGGLVEQRS